MDAAVAWFQEEQDGPAKRLWMGIWETVSEMDSAVNSTNNTNANTITTSNSSNNLEIKSKDSSTQIGNGNGNNETNNGILVNNEKNYNPTRKKAGSTIDNKASTYNMNKLHARLVGMHGGCPWR